VHRYILDIFVKNNMFFNKLHAKESKFFDVHKEREKETFLCR
jgi:hypothetical protein